MFQITDLLTLSDLANSILLYLTFNKFQSNVSALLSERIFPIHCIQTSKDKSNNTKHEYRHSYFRNRLAISLVPQIISNKQHPLHILHPNLRDRLNDKTVTIGGIDTLIPTIGRQSLPFPG